MILVDECSICRRDIDGNKLHLPELTCFKCQPHHPWSPESRDRFKKLKRKQWEWLKMEAYAQKTKVCSKCNQEKPKTEFNKLTAALDGKNGVCRVCTKESYQHWRQKAYSLDY